MWTNTIGIGNHMDLSAIFNNPYTLLIRTPGKRANFHALIHSYT